MAGWDDEILEDPRAPADLTPEERLRRDGALRQLRQWGDPVLRTPTTAVTDVDDRLRAQIARMAALMDDAVGAGLAAPQVGAVQRLFVHRLGAGAPLGVMVNPVITAASEERQTGVEGCLSIPLVVVEVERAQAITMVGLDAEGEEREVHAEGRDAVILQHELDHLDGVLMLDRAAPDERRRAIRTLRERERA